jgi:hypothetical protein
LGDIHKCIDDDIAFYLVQPADLLMSFNDEYRGHIAVPLLHALEREYQLIFSASQLPLASANNQSLLPYDTLSDMKAALMHLKRLSVSWREFVEIVATLQQGILEIRGFILFRQDVESKYRRNPHFIATSLQCVRGAITRHRWIFELLRRLGVPVWIIRSESPEWAHRNRAVMVDATPCKDHLVLTSWNVGVHFSFRDYRGGTTRLQEPCPGPVSYFAVSRPSRHGRIIFPFISCPHY